MTGYYRSSSSTATSCSYPGSDTWGGWVETASTSTSTVFYADSEASETWTIWCESTGTASTSGSVWRMWQTYKHVSAFSLPAAPQRSPEEIEAENLRLKAENEALQKKYEEEKKRREAAEKVAEELLVSYLDQQQREQYAKENAFHLISQEGKRYRIERKRSGNVLELDERDGQHHAVARYCLHSVDPVPVADDMLVSLLMLRHNEREYLKTANKTKVTPYVVGPAA